MSGRQGGDVSQGRSWAGQISDAQHTTSCSSSGDMTDSEGPSPPTWAVRAVTAVAL